MKTITTLKEIFDKLENNDTIAIHYDSITISGPKNLIAGRIKITEPELLNKKCIFYEDKNDVFINN